MENYMGLYITFFGHKDTLENAELNKKLTEVFKSFFNFAFENNEKLIFLCGGYGNFDKLAADKIDKLRKQYFNISCEKAYVTPYIGDRLNEHLIKLKYDTIIYPPIENVPLRFAIQYRNKWMIKNANYVVIHVTHSWGNTVQIDKFARNQHKTVIYV